MNSYAKCKLRKTPKYIIPAFLVKKKELIMTEGSQNGSFIRKIVTIFSKIPLWELSFVFIIFIVIRYLPDNINAISTMLGKTYVIYIALIDISLKGVLLIGSFWGICWRSKYFREYYFSHQNTLARTETPPLDIDNTYNEEIRDATEDAAKRR